MIGDPSETPRKVWSGKWGNNTGQPMLRWGPARHHNHQYPIGKYMSALKKNFSASLSKSINFGCAESTK
jgi:hypothetical protein